MARSTNPRTRRRAQRTFGLLALGVPLLLAAACGGSEATDDSTTTTSAGTSATQSTDTGASSGSGAGTWLMNGQRIDADSLDCLLTRSTDGATLEVLGQGSVAGGTSYAQLRIVDSPASIGDASVVVSVDGEEYREEFDASGAETNEVGDLFWEVDDQDKVVVLGSVPIAGSDVDIDLEVACEVLGDGEPSGSAGSSDGSGDADEVLGTLTADGEAIELSGTCSYDATGGGGADVASAQMTGDDGGWGVVFAVSGAASRNSQVSIGAPDGRTVVRWERDGSLSQSNAEGAYQLADGRLTIETSDPVIQIDVACDER